MTILPTLTYLGVSDRKLTIKFRSKDILYLQNLVEDVKDNTSLIGKIVDYANGEIELVVNLDHHIERILEIVKYLQEFKAKCVFRVNMDHGEIIVSSPTTTARFVYDLAVIDNTTLYDGKNFDL